jgi:hypothetical protein
MPAPMSGPQYAPVQYTQVKERGFNPVTFIGWRATRTVPVQQIQQPYPPQAGW